jgi:hypothetical protein
VTIVLDAFAGPPIVMIHTMSNSCSEPMIDRKAQIRIVGLSSGSVMRRVVCQADAPSIAAASRSSAGMPCRPASRRMIPNPMYFQSVDTVRIVSGCRS